jgi:hypothetical protein
MGQERTHALQQSSSLAYSELRTLIGEMSRANVLWGARGC